MAKKSIEISKEELRRPDAFARTMEQSFGFTTKYSKPLAAVAVLAIVIAVGLLLADFLRERSEVAAAQALYQPQSEYTKLRNQYDSAKFPQDPKATTKAVAATGDLQKDYGSVIPGFEKIIKEHPGTVAAGQAGVYLASIYLNYGKFDEAKVALAAPLKELKSGTLIYSVAYMVNGNIHASQGNCQEAVASYERIKNFLSLDAAVKAGVCYEKLGQLDRAAEMYKKASADAESQTSLAAKGLLKALEQKRQTQPSTNQAG